VRSSNEIIRVNTFRIVHLETSGREFKVSYPKAKDLTWAVPIARKQACPGNVVLH
jgi:hypothetical protein